MPARIVEIEHGGYLISTDPARVDVDAVHRFLCHESYWAAGRPRDVQARAIEHSGLVGGAYRPGGEQVGFARMVTDLATFAWLADVYELSADRGRGLGAALVRTMVEHPDVVGVQRQILATDDAHELYGRLGYRPLDDPNHLMYRTPTRST